MDVDSVYCSRPACEDCAIRKRVALQTIGTIVRVLTDGAPERAFMVMRAVSAGYLFMTDDAQPAVRVSHLAGECTVPVLSDLATFASGVTQLAYGKPAIYAPHSRADGVRAWALIELMTMNGDGVPPVYGQIERVATALSVSDRVHLISYCGAVCAALGATFADVAVWTTLAFEAHARLN